MRKRVVVIDGPNLAHRVRHTTDLRTAKGKPTGVLYGTISSILHLAELFDPDHIIVAWDGKMKSWRYGEYKPYKSARRLRCSLESERDKELREEFYAVQIPDTKRALTGFGITQIELDTLEADDILACVAEPTSVEKAKAQYLLVSTDKDIIQCIASKRGRVIVQVFNPVTEEVFVQDKSDRIVGIGRSGEERIVAPSPRTYLLHRAIIGDSSDSIVGVPGVGEKTVADNLSVVWDPQEGVLDYLQRCDTKGKRGQAMLDNAEVILRNIRIMQLGRSIVTERGLTKADKKFILQCAEPRGANDNAMVITIPEFLQGVLKTPTRYAHPNWYKLHGVDHPAVRFFMVREFSWAYDVTRCADILKHMARLFSLKAALAMQGELYGGV